MNSLRPVKAPTLKPKILKHPRYNEETETVHTVFPGTI